MGSQEPAGRSTLLRIHASRVTEPLAYELSMIAWHSDLTSILSLSENAISGDYVYPVNSTTSNKLQIDRTSSTLTAKQQDPAERDVCLGDDNLIQA